MSGLGSEIKFNIDETKIEVISRAQRVRTWLVKVLEDTKPNLPETDKVQVDDAIAWLKALEV